MPVISRPLVDLFCYTSFLLATPDMANMMQVPPQVPPMLYNITVTKDRSNYLQVHFDTNIAGNLQTLYTTILVSTSLKVPDVIMLTCEKKGFAGEKVNCAEVYSLYEVRYQGSKIIYQRRLDHRERPMDIYERWTKVSVSEYMKFVLTKNPSQYARFLVSRSLSHSSSYFFLFSFFLFPVSESNRPRPGLTMWWI